MMIIYYMYMKLSTEEPSLCLKTPLLHVFYINIDQTKSLKLYIAKCH